MISKRLFRRLGEVDGIRVGGLTVVSSRWLGGIAVLFTSLTVLGGAIALFQPQTGPITEPLSNPPAEPLPQPDPIPPAWGVAIDVLPGAVPLPSISAKRHPDAPNPYDQAMTIGYRAYREGDYNTALINFKRALEAKEGDRAASEAIRNVEAILEHYQQQETP